MKLKSFPMKITLRHLLALCLLTSLIATRLPAQTVIGGTTPHPSAELDVQSTNKGLLPPRLTTAERNAIAEPATGLLIFNTTLNCIEMNVGVPAQPIWVCLSTAAGVTAYGGPGCSGLGSIQGTMNAGFPVSGVTMTLYANVTWPGIWSLTATQNGVTFSGAGNFTSPGCQPITLTAVGTPIAPGTFTWTTGTQPAGSASGVVNCTVSGASSTPTVCINTPLPDITHTTTGATGIGTPTGFPAGVTASWQGNVITISGTPEEAGVFGYSIPLEGECGSIWAAGNITVSPDDVVSSLTSDYTYCINTPLSVTTHATTGATGIGTPTGLPAGLTANWQYNTLAISGTATEVGTFNYSIPLAGGCGNVEAQGAITVKPANTVSPASSNPVLCINTPLTAITHTTTGATGITNAGVSGANGLPAGVSAAWAGNTITISGTPTVAGIYNYSIPLEGGCGSFFAVGAIEVLTNTVSAASTTPVVSINTALPLITLTTTGATGIGTPTGLPAGVTASFAGDVITISGTPTEGGIFNYSILLTGGCGNVIALGTIRVKYCGAYIAPGEWKEFMCHNLGADQSADPFTPRWRINGDYYQWGRAAVAATGPTGPSSGEANAGAIADWNTIPASSGAWQDDTKTANDPCPQGFRVPTISHWMAVINSNLNPNRTYVGNWENNATNYSSGLRVESGSTVLFLPSSGNRADNDGSIGYRGIAGNYWSSTKNGNDVWLMAHSNGYVDRLSYSPNYGFSIRCIAE